MPFSAYYTFFGEADPWEFTVKYVENETDRFFIKWRGGKVRHVKVKTLLDIVIHMYYCYSYLYMGTENVSVKKIYKRAVKQIGKKIVLRQFPEEKLNDCFIRDVLNRCDEMHEKSEAIDHKYMKENELSETEGIDWTRACDNEIERMDDETDGFWRISNDLD